MALSAAFAVSACQHNTGNVEEATSSSGGSASSTGNSSTSSGSSGSTETSSTGSTPVTFTIGGTISGLGGSGLVLTNNGGDALTVPAGSTDFTFASSVASASSYAISIDTQPWGAQQSEFCTIANAAGAVDAANVTSVSITCTVSVPRFAYVATQGDGKVTAYSIDAAGTLTELTDNATLDTPNGLYVYSIACHPSGNFAYVLNTSGTGQGEVAAYTIAKTGALTLVPSTTSAPNPAATGAGVGNIAIDPGGRFAYVTNAYSGTIAAYGIDATSGALTAITDSPYAEGQLSPWSSTFAPWGKYFYVGNAEGNVSNNLHAYSMADDSGALTAISAYTAGNAPGGVAIEASGKFLYTANNDGTISGYVIDSGSGALSELPASPFQFSVTPIALAADPLGRFLFVSFRGTGTWPNNAAGTAAAYAIDSSGNLTLAGSAQTIGHESDTITGDPSGKFVYVLNYDDNPGTLSAFSVTASGLVPLGTSATMNIAATPRAMAITGGPAN